MTYRHQAANPGGLDMRFWIAAGAASLLALVVLGVPTAVVPNPFFTRMTPTRELDVVFWLLSSGLAGATIATYVARPPGESHAVESGKAGTSLAGIGAFLAIGCPVCNKIVIALLGVSGALNVWAPLQPIVGSASVALLGLTLAYRLRLRRRGCHRCVAATG